MSLRTVVFVALAAIALGVWLSPGRAEPVVLKPSPALADVMVCGEALDGMPGTACYHLADVPESAEGTWTLYPN